MKKLNKIISIIGICPPPIGGVSIHVKRLSHNLNSLNLLYKGYNFNNFKILPNTNIIVNKLWFFINSSFKSIIIFFQLLFFDRSKIVHLHNEEFLGPFLYLIWLFKRKKLILTIHDQIRFQNKIGIQYFIRKLSIKLFVAAKTEFIVVNRNILIQLVEYGVDVDRISIIPAYLKSNKEKVQLKSEVSDFIECHKFVLSIYAHSTRMLNGVDLYGVDLAIELIRNLKMEGFDVGLIILIPDLKDLSRLIEYEDIVNSYRINDEVLFIKEGIEDTLELWRKCQIHLRLTNTDGDALTVREALSVGSSVIASDAVERPNGTIVYKNRNLKNLIDVTIKSLNSIDKIANKVLIENDNFDPILRIYKNILTIN